MLSQGDLVAKSLQEYLSKHPNMDSLLSKNETTLCYTTGDSKDFEAHASLFFGSSIQARHCNVVKKS
jgi:glutamate racemase